MATLRTMIQLTDGMSSPLRSMNNALNTVINSFEVMQTASHNPVDVASLQGARAQLNQVDIALNQVEQQIREANQQQDQFNQRMRTGRSEATGLGNAVKGFVTAFAGMVAIKQGAEVTDTYVNQNARLALINDGLQTNAELQQKIFQAAERSRGAYNDTVNTVAKLGLLAKDAFRGNDETIRFAELMNKSFRVAGASSSESSNGMYQLTQAMAAGKLQGDEFRSVMENAPMVADAIAKYMGKTKGELKEMSSKGVITAEIIKNAMFLAADDINAKFETMPVTFGSTMTHWGNVAVMKFSSVMQRINNTLNSDSGEQMIQGVDNAIGVLANSVGFLITTLMVVSGFFNDNWGIIEPIVWGIVAAYVAYNADALITNGIQAALAAKEALHTMAMIASTSATWGVAYAQGGLNAALYASPITWVILAVLALIVAFYAVIGAINKFAGTSYSATGIIAGAFMLLLAVIGNVLVGAFNLIIDTFALTQNFIASFAEFFANVFNDPIGSIIRLFSSMADAILSIISGIASAMDTLFGSNLAKSVEGWRGKLQGMTNDLVGEARIKVDRVDPNALHLKRFEYGKAFNMGNEFGKNLESKLNFENLFGGNAADDLKYSSETASNTSAMKDTMKASEEDLKYLRDIAEQEAINKFTTAEIKIDMTNHNNVASNMDLDGVVTYLEEKLYEGMVAAAEGVHN